MTVEQLDDIFDAIVERQKAIVKPTGEKALAQAFDEPPTSTSLFPAFYNVETGIEINRGPSRRQLDHLIDMQLIFSRTDQKYSVRLRRKWVQAVLDTFDTDLRLHKSGVAQSHFARIESVDYDPLDLGEYQYVTATFHLRVTVDGAFAFSSG